MNSDSSRRGKRLCLFTHYIPNGPIRGQFIVVYHVFNPEYLRDHEEFFHVDVLVEEDLMESFTSIVVPEEVCSAEAGTILHHHLSGVFPKTLFDIVAAFFSLVDYLHMIPSMNESFTAGAA